MNSRCKYLQRKKERLLMKTRLIRLLPACVCLLAVATTYGAPQSPAKNKAVVRTQLAGAELNTDLPNFRKFDAKQGYFLVRFTDGLGRALVTQLRLFPALNDDGDSRYDDSRSLKMQRTTLPSVRNGWGVNIGDSSETVQRKLGRAPDFSRKMHSDVKVYVYKAPISLVASGRKVKWQYTAEYRFTKNRLRVINYEAREPIVE